jgi:hypothetical protein
MPRLLVGEAEAEADEDEGEVGVGEEARLGGSQPRITTTIQNSASRAVSRRKRRGGRSQLLRLCAWKARRRRERMVAKVARMLGDC